MFGRHRHHPAPRRQHGRDSVQHGDGEVNVVSMTAVRPGQRATIAFVRGGRGVVQRLSDLGLTPETPFFVLSSAPLNGPLQVAVRGCTLAIGRGIAQKIFVRLEES